MSYEYPVYFTSNVFSPENGCLIAAITRKELARRHRLLVVVEEVVAAE
ncbi:MAG: hypothetical protein M3477_01925 [Gemmatimonadota bacterium]|nr:hypothetical protein [Gemmatimonadota bacterium]